MLSVLPAALQLPDRGGRRAAPSELLAEPDIPGVSHRLTPGTDRHSQTVARAALGMVSSKRPKPPTRSSRRSVASVHQRMLVNWVTTGLPVSRSMRAMLSTIGHCGQEM